MRNYTVTVSREQEEFEKYYSKRYDISFISIREARVLCGAYTNTHTLGRNLNYAWDAWVAATNTNTGVVS